MARPAAFIGLALAIAASLGVVAPARASRVATLLEQADAVRSRDPQAFASLLDRAHAMRAQASEPERQHLRLLQAYRRVIVGDYPRALEDAEALVTQARDPDIRYRAALLVANTTAVTRDYVRGLQYLERALAMQPQVKDPATRSLGVGVATTLYTQYELHDLALHHAEAGLRQALPPRVRCFVRVDRIYALQGLGKPVDEVRDLQPALADCGAQGEAIAVTMLHVLQAKHLTTQGRMREAIAVLEDALPNARTTRYSRIVGEVLGLLAQYRATLGNHAGAEAAARQVLQLRGQNPGWWPVVKAHRALYEAAHARGDLRTALEHHRQYADAEKAHLDDVKAREFAAQLARHELFQREHSARLLQEQNHVLRLRGDIARRRAWNLGLLVALFAAVALAATGWGWRSRRTHRALRRMAETDVLTGLSNRRHFRESVERALAVCAQRQLPVSVLLLDLDHFKQINDECGHPAGDWVLREVARVGRGYCREGDLYGRIGGEEFAMALVGCNIDDAMRIAEACRQAIEAIDAAPAPCTRPVTASIGVACTAHAGYDYETLLADADAAMYRSKVGGRNRVTSSTADVN